MDHTAAAPAPRLKTSLLAVVELSKPVTWFPPMWAFGCGVVSSGQMSFDNLWLLIGGVLLAGPLLCAGSQAVNDWFDRHVDAINEPGRPIPSGRIPGRWGLWIAIFWSVAGLVWASFLGVWVLAAAAAGVALSWAYSAPPVRLKRSGIWGPLSVGFSYEGLAWFTGAAVMAQALPDARTITLAVLYSLGAYGIMVLNDFKAIEGDRAMGLKSLPAALGPRKAAWIACVTMAVPQAVVIALLMIWNTPLHAGLVGLSLAIQIALMARLMRDPKALAPWYNATGVMLYVLGMLASAFALSGLNQAAL
ncbi:chlorophyll synthase ChlG [Alkalicaulis satelles]|uniref:Chlorophyll synthase ChlG n=1 Tax=Alkalicaulis satelles TaxID=2609175 RepID=A0A5M6ZK22_9PROT|nr:chlorophyll synthase ChlG [Alkalicaulis satelles]KAA5804017.1 chlorophyll synthase ChlG [Alkalicaulis satelles]